MSGAGDDSVYNRAQSTGAIVITRDLDFADERRFTDSVGIVVVRFRTRIRARELVDTALRLLADALSELENLGNGIIILEPGRTRVRRR
jgi:predicted nuclease of predicted toxin-antitoxin system